MYFQKKEYDTANSYFFKVKELDPSYTSVYSYLAKGFLELADEKRALEQVEEGLFYDRQNASLYAMGAEAAKILGDLDKSRQFYQEAIGLDPDNITMILEYVQVLFGQQAFEEALAVFEPVLESGEEDPQLFWYAAIAYNEEEAFEEARGYYDKAAVYLSDNADFLKDYAVFLREDGDRAGFINTARRYLELKPDDLEVREWIKYEDGL